MTHGASSLGEWERAERAAERALAVATERSEARIQFAAESLLGAVRQRRRADIAAVASGSSPEDEGDSLARDLVHQLAGSSR